jgi:hypothetical protein
MCSPAPTRETSTVVLDKLNVIIDRLNVIIVLVVCTRSGVIALFVFSVLAPWWPNEESDWTEIWSVSYSYLD